MENAYRVGGQTAFDFLKDETILRRLAYVHAKNFGETPEGWNSTIALDEGVNDIHLMLAVIKAHGYDGWISIEFSGTTRDKLKRSVKFYARAGRCCRGGPSRITLGDIPAVVAAWPAGTNSAHRICLPRRPSDCTIRPDKVTPTNSVCF